MLEVHVEACAEADWGDANDPVFDPDAVCVERHEEADLGPGRLVKVALGELEDGEEDDADGPEHREEKPPTGTNTRHMTLNLTFNQIEELEASSPIFRWASISCTNHVTD